MSIYFATPCYRSNPQQSAQWAANKARELNLKGAKVSLQIESPLLPIARSRTISDFYNEKFCTHIFMRDDDINIRAETLQKMISADVPAILVPYKLRKKDRFDVVFDESGNLLWGGLGCALVRRDVIDTLWKKYFEELHFYDDDGSLRVHLFRDIYATINNDNMRRLMKEDHSFWYRVRESGFSLNVIEGEEIIHSTAVSKYPNILEVKE
jgi:hypothetical protein